MNASSSSCSVGRCVSDIVVVRRNFPESAGGYFKYLSAEPSRRRHFDRLSGFPTRDRPLLAAPLSPVQS